MLGVVLRVWQPVAGHSRCLANGPLLASSAENKVPSMIIALTDGTLESISLQETKQQVSPDHHYQLSAPRFW